jgi:hypothetical protein
MKPMAIFESSGEMPQVHDATFGYKDFAKQPVAISVKLKEDRRSKVKATTIVKAKEVAAAGALPNKRIRIRGKRTFAAAAPALEVAEVAPEVSALEIVEAPEVPAAEIVEAPEHPAVEAPRPARGDTSGCPYNIPMPGNIDSSLVPLLGCSRCRKAPRGCGTASGCRAKRAKVIGELVALLDRPD